MEIRVDPLPEGSRAKAPSDPAQLGFGKYFASRMLSAPWTEARWRRYVRAYLREMREPRARHLIATLAALSRPASFSVGCYCEDEAMCHRSLLRGLLLDAGAVLSRAAGVRKKAARPR